MSRDPPLARLESRTRRRLIAGAVLRIALTTGSLLAVYYLIPLEHFGDTAALVYFLIGGAIFAGALTWQLRAILVADYPGIRAIEAIGVVLPLLVVVFATVYVTFGNADPGNFSEQLSRSASLYFTITILSTVGFGDITPRTDAARLVVSLQMLLDLVLLGVILKLILGAAQSGLERQRSQPKDPDVGA
jgi:voltage-gated potassium channel